MHISGKVLIGFIIVVAAVNIWMSMGVVESWRNWEIKVAAKAKEVADTEEAIEARAHGSDASRKKFEEMANDMLLSASAEARGEFKRMLDTGADPRYALEVAMSDFVDKKALANFSASLDRLAELQAGPNVDPTQRGAAIAVYDAAVKELEQATTNLEDAYKLYMSNQPYQTKGVRTLLDVDHPEKSLGLDAAREATDRVQRLTIALAGVFRAQLSKGDKNKTVRQDEVESTKDAANRWRLSADNAEEDRKARVNEKEDIDAAYLRTDADRVVQEAKQKQLEEKQAELIAAFQDAMKRCSELVLLVKDLENRFDWKRGLDGVVLDENGKVPTGRVRRVDETEGTLHINMGTRVGVKPGARLQVYRWSDAAQDRKYLGVMEVARSESDSAVGRMLPEYRQLTIRPDDVVSTEITVPPGKNPPAPPVEN